MSVSAVLCAVVITAEFGADLPEHSVSPLILGGTATAVHLAAYGGLLLTRRKQILRAAFVPVSAVVVLTVAGAGLFHLDFFRSAFHALASCYIIFLYHRRYLPWAATGKAGSRAINWFSSAMLVVGLMWVLVHAYAGIILQSSAAEYWVAFNLYTVGLLGIGLVVLLRVSHDPGVRVTISPDSLTADGRDYTGLLGTTDLRLLSYLANAPDRHVTCADIVVALNGVQAGADAVAEDCRRCISSHEKASLCPHYRRTYNQVLKIKRTIEALGIGTIVAPPNKMNITTDGWALKLHENVHLG